MDADKLISEFEAYYNSAWGVDLTTAVSQRGAVCVLKEFINWINDTQITKS